MSESLTASTDPDLISFLRAIPDTRMRRGIRIPAWYLELVAIPVAAGGVSIDPLGHAERDPRHWGADDKRTVAA